MTHRCLTAIAVTVLLAVPTTLADDTTPQQGIRDNTPNVIAFTGATIVVSPGKAFDDATLLVRDGRVAAVGTGVDTPADAVVFDATGLTIYPGFVDPYTQYGIEPAPGSSGRGRPAPVYEGKRVGGNAWNDAIHAEQQWVTEFEPDAKDAKKFMELGYTVVQSTKMDGIFRGTGFVTSLADELPNDTILSEASRQFISFDKGSSKQAYPNSLMGTIAMIRQTLLDADWSRRAREAARKNPELERPEVNRALDALGNYDGPFIVESRDALTLLRASRIGAEFGRQMIFVGSNADNSRIDEIASLKSTIILPVSLPRRPEMIRAGDELEVTLGQLRNWERAPATAALLEARKVPFAFTSWRLGSEEDFFTNIKDMIKSGLTPTTALAALTTVPARIAGIEREAGSLEKGKRADFIIASGDLFADGKIDSVWIDGRRARNASPDFRGTFETKLGDLAVKLKISGSTKGQKASILVGEDSTEEESLTLADQSGVFAIDLTPIGIDGTGWFRLEKSQFRVRLAYTAPDGLASYPDLKIVMGEDDEEKEKKEPKDVQLISRRTMPDLAFGWESLPASETVLVRNATLWTSDAAGVVENADMLVEDGRIAKIGTNLTAPTGARVIDATGKHVTPGVIDEHSHLAISGGVNEGTHAATAEARIGDVLNPDHIGIYRALAGGVTTAQLLHGSANPIGAQAQVVKLKWGQESEGLKLETAPGSIKFALGENVKQSNWGDQFNTRYPQTRMGVETYIRDRFIAASEYRDSWAKWNGLSKKERARAMPPRRDLQLETLVEILESKRFIHCHSYVQSEILMLMRLAEDLGFRIGTFTHILEGYKVATEMAKHGAGASAFADWWAYKYEVVDAIPQAVCITNERGVVTSVNSDSANTIRRLNQDAGKAVMYCGMSETDALKMVTINPAIQLGIDSRTGSLTEGKDADFTIWNGHPLSMYSKAEQTWIEGTNYFDLERDAAMRTRDAEEKAALVEKALRSTDKRGGDPPGAADQDDYHCGDMGETSHAR